MAGVLLRAVNTGAQGTSHPITPPTRTCLGTIETLELHTAGEPLPAAYFTGRSTFLFDPEDPLRDGFLLR